MSDAFLSQQPRWIIDCDPGCDDAVALALAAAHLDVADVEILTCAGNVDVDLTTWNACRILNACGVDSWKVYRGCAGSLSGEAVPASSVHGRDGLGDIPNNAFKTKIIEPRKPEEESAVSRYLALAEDRFVLVCTGPLTNLASALNLMAFKDQQRFWEQCEICVVMGGVFESYGNITAAAEFNTHFDPVAVHLVLESWRKCEESIRKRKEGKNKINPIHFVPLDVTELVALPLHEVPGRPAYGASQAAEFLLAALRKYGLFHARYCMRPQDQRKRPLFGVGKLDEDRYLSDRVVGKNGQKHLGPFCYLHDPLAVWVALQRQSPGFFSWWADGYVTMDISHGASRGQFIQHSKERLEQTPSRATLLGTHVRWLKPERFGPRKRQIFVNCIEQLLGLTRSKQSIQP
jgi:inosine-uridine nucleoside N-ribohydrolase